MRNIKYSKRCRGSNLCYYSFNHLHFETLSFLRRILYYLFIVR
jgi:hypothetical protein